MNVTITFWKGVVWWGEKVNEHLMATESSAQSLEDVSPRKARKYKKYASPSRKLSPVKEAEHVKKAKRVKRPTKKSTTAPTTGVVIRDTPGVSVSKKKAPTKGDKGKGMKLLSDATLLEAAQVKVALQKSKKDSHMLHASGSGDGVGSQPKVPDESEEKKTGTDEGTGTKPGVPDVLTYDSESENESWGDNEDDTDDDSDDDSKGDDDKADSDDDGNSDADDNERTDSDDDDKNPSFTLKDYNEEEHEEEYESDDDYENMFEEEDDDLYKDVNVRSLGAEHEKERKGDEEMTDANQNVSQEKSYEQVVEDAHVTLTSSQKTESSKQSSSVSSDFASKFLILDNVPPVVDEVASMMNVKNRQEESSTQAPSLFTVPETAIPETSTAHATTVPPTISMITPLPQLTTPSPAPTTVPTTTSIPALPDFSSLFGFDQRVSTLETELSQLKQADHSAQLLESVKSQLPTMVDDLLSTRIGYATRTALQSYTKEFEKKAQEERKLYIDVVEKSVKDIIKDEVKSLLPQILPKVVSDFATPVIQRTITKSLENLDKDLFGSYGKLYSLKRSHEDKDKDEDSPAGPDQGLKKKKKSKDVEPSRGSKLKESKTSSSKGTKSQPKSSGKSVQAEEPVFETADTEMPQDQGGDTEDQPNVEATPMNDWFKKPERPPTPDPDWNATKSIDNLTQEILVGPAFNLLKGNCKSFVELEYHFKECYKAVTDQLDWNNPEGHEYPFNLSKPLPLIEA
ncbi:hypothetical protein Tco_1065998 [Tanacetum coccineum]